MEIRKIKRRNIDWHFFIALLYPVVAVALIIGLLYKYYFLDISYRSVCLNSDKNVIDSEESYIFSSGKSIYLYNFETEETELIYEGTIQNILSVSVYGDYIYFVFDGDAEVHRYNYRTNDDEILLHSKDDIMETDICNGYLIYRTWKQDYFLYPAAGNTEEEPISVESIFEERGDKTSPDIQTITYEGMDITGYYRAKTGKASCIAIRNHENGKVLIPQKELFMLSDERYLQLSEWGEKVECNVRYMGEPEVYEITCLRNKDLGKEPVFYEKYMIQEGNEVICLLQKTSSEYGSIYQKDSRGDILFKWNIETGESSVLYETSSRRTRIIGYKNGSIYLLHNNQVSVQPADGGKGEKLFRIPMGKRIYYFDWQGDYLIVTGANGEVMKAYKTGY